MDENVTTPTLDSAAPAVGADASARPGLAPAAPAVGADASVRPGLAPAAPQTPARQAGSSCPAPDHSNLSVGRDDPGAPQTAPAALPPDGAPESAVMPAEAPAVPRTAQDNVNSAADGAGERDDAAPDGAENPMADDARDDEDFRDLMAQADALGQDYPGFDLWTELSDDRFATLVAALRASGYPDALATAYRGVHHDALMASALRAAVERTAARMADSFRAGANRPAEGPGPGLTAAADPAHMTPRQIEEVRRRVMMGQKVSF